MLIDRLVDVDLWCYYELILDSSTSELPQPLMQEVAFVMEPMAEIAPDVRHPVLKKTMQELYRTLVSQK